MPANRVSQIINAKRAVSGDTALRLAHWFGTTPQFWMNLQALYDVRLAEQLAGAEIGALPRRQTAKSPRKTTQATSGGHELVGRRVI